MKRVYKACYGMTDNLGGVTRGEGSHEIILPLISEGGSANGFNAVATYSNNFDFSDLFRATASFLR